MAERIQLHQGPCRPEPDHSYYSVSLQDEFPKRNLQVVVKMASIELSLEKPSYLRERWHLDGLNKSTLLQQQSSEYLAAHERYF